MVHIPVTFQNGRTLLSHELLLKENPGKDEDYNAVLVSRILHSLISPEKVFSAFYESNLEGVSLPSVSELLEKLKEKLGTEECIFLLSLDEYQLTLNQMDKDKYKQL